MSNTTQVALSNTTLSTISTVNTSVAENTIIASVQSSAATPGTTSPSGISIQQSAEATTTNTSSFLSLLTSIKSSTPNATDFATTSNSSAFSSINASVTATAEVATPTSTSQFTLSDAVDSNTNFTTNATIEGTSTSTSPTASETSSATRMRTTASEESTSKTSVTSSSNLSTKKTDEGMVKIGDCLLDFTTSNSDSTTMHVLMNICTGKPTVGHVKENCTVTVNEKDSGGEFRLKKQVRTHTVNTKQGENCQNPIQLGPAPGFDGVNKTTVSRCIKDNFSLNGDGTVSHKIVNTCGKKRHGYIAKDCSFYPADEWNAFTLDGKGTYKVILTHDTDNCRNPIKTGKPAIHATSTPTTIAPSSSTINNELTEPPSYESRFCPTKNDSLTYLPDTPKAEKIIFGEDLSTLDARHLVQIRGAKGVCSGTLIGDRYALTSAHCVSSNGEGNRLQKTYPQPDCINNLSVWHDPYPAKTGTQYLPRTSYQVKAGHIAPCYRNEVYVPCDLAILELAQPVLHGKTVQFPTAEDFCEFAQSLDDVAKKSSLHSISNNVRHRLYNRSGPVWKNGNAIVQGFGTEKNEKDEYVSSGRAKQEKVVTVELDRDDKIIIVEPRTQGGSTCSGDSGGPLLFQTKSGKKVQIGVSSTGKSLPGIPCAEKLNTLSTSIYPHVQWIKERMEENSGSVRIESGDLSRLRICPETCVSRKDQPDGFLSWLGSFTFTIRGPRRLTFTNNCHGKNHPSAVNINFYSGQEEEKKLESIYEIEAGKTKTFFTDGTLIKSTLTWSDVAKKTNRH